MKWSWKIARIAGIDIYVHVTFFLLVYLVGASYYNQKGTFAAAIYGVGYIVALFFCVVLHELGHSLTARHYGIQTRNITLLPIGGIAALEKLPENPRHEINVAIAGPAVNFVIAMVLYLYLEISGGQVMDPRPVETDGPLLYRLMIVNILLGSFNLLPAFPMDGGRILRAALSFGMDRIEATRKAASVGRFLAVGMGLLGVLYNPFLLFIAIFVWFGASTESSAERLKSILGRARARHAMLREFHTLAPDDTLSSAIDLTLLGSQKDFPVGYKNNLTKVLHYADLIDGLKQKGEHARISDLPLQDILVADINEPLENLIQDMQGNLGQMICVTEHGKIVGLLNLENIIEMIKIHEALEDHARTGL
jgi:Zn-dependent protease